MAMTISAAPQTVLERMIMPGPLALSHAKYEGDCAKCHRPFSRQSQTSLCLDCHTEISADRSAERGFHGRQVEAAKQECNRCHTDHKGRQADIVSLDRETFDHDDTNYQLVDAHRSVTCVQCHLSTVAFRKAPSRCIDCHRQIDPHRGALGEVCDTCHSVSAWHQTRTFDHTKTKFPLEGAHRDVGCATCHVGQVYKDISHTCVSCHRLQDVHAQRYGNACETCHDQTRFKPAHFDHDKTKYPLRGAHAKVACDACHIGFIYRDKLNTTCVSCHRRNDPHQGQLGQRCQTCHDDVDWQKKILFDHDLTRFPLIGLHASVLCEECHRNLTFKNTPILCERCHQDSHHQGRLSARCATCHTPNGWARWQFDHTRQANYALTGAHAKLACETCHATRNPPTLRLATDCYSCHRRADAHSGSFGRSCERCHGTSNWRALKFRT